jgi:hypothetical protein
MSKDESQPRTVNPRWLFPVILILTAGFGLLAGVQMSNMYLAAHPQISTVTSSTTSTVSQTQTETSFSTITQTSVSTSVSTQNQNGNFYYDNPNYNPNYNRYPNYQCQYPYYNSQYCYGNQNQYQLYSGTISQSGSCILFYSSSDTYYLDLSNLNGNSYPNGPITIRGYVESPYYQAGCGAYPLLYVGSVSQ